MAYAALRLKRADVITHAERRISWQRADKIAGRRLDRRKNYMVIKGQVCSAVNFTTRCSGCSEDVYDDRGGGCSECGYHGVVRQSYWMPDDGSMPR